MISIYGVNIMVFIIVACRLYIVELLLVWINRCSAFACCALYLMNSEL